MQAATSVSANVAAHAAVASAVASTAARATATAAPHQSARLHCSILLPDVSALFSRSNFAASKGGSWVAPGWGGTAVAVARAAELAAAGVAAGCAVTVAAAVVAARATATASPLQLSSAVVARLPSMVVGLTAVPRRSSD